MLNSFNPKKTRIPQAPGADRFPTLGRSPAPRLSNKHELNPPIVTIFGAGIAGLTVAHELAERGFLVQVVDKARDPYSKRPAVGGMAATQTARVRANIESLHANLLPEPRPRKKKRVPAETTSPAPDPLRAEAMQWLLSLFTLNRSYWIQTERPEDIHTALYSFPNKETSEAPDAKTISDVVMDMLVKARERYRARWIWDLTVRRALIAKSVGAQGFDPADCAKALSDHETLLKVPTSEALIKALSDRAPGAAPSPLSSAALQAHGAEMAKALEREFLCFRLVPFARTGVERGNRAARVLLKEWEDAFAGTALEHCLQRWNLAECDADPDERIPVRSGELPPRAATGPNDPGEVEAWLELEIIEQRLPGEHGFRFFPAYYRHLDDTMKRIPLFDDQHRVYGCVFDNLRPTTVQGIGLSAQDTDELAKTARTPRLIGKEERKAGRVVRIERDRPRSLEGLRARTDLFMRNLGCTPKDGALFFARLMRFMTSCPRRREHEYAGKSWAQFIGIDPDPSEVPPPPAREQQREVDAALLKYSQAMKDQLKAASQVLLAFSVAQADAHSYGSAAAQLFMDVLEDGSRIDRTLNGPTSDAWLEPWREYLERQGVRFFYGTFESFDRSREGEVVPRMNLDQPFSQDGYPMLTSDDVDPGCRPDFYVLALDLQQAAASLKSLPEDEVSARDFKRASDFALRAKVESRLDDGESALKDMTGLQFFFDAKTSIGEGHLYYPYSEWGLSSISQSEFWSRRGGFADGYLGVLSVDVADTHNSEHHFWNLWRQAVQQTPDATSSEDPPTPEILAARKAATGDLARWQAAMAAWAQIEGRTGKDRLSVPRCYHVDQNIGWDREHGVSENSTRYLATLPGQFDKRPGFSDRLEPDGTKAIEYAINHGRWVLCGTHMATSTRLTTMEAANESGRRAVHAILKRLQPPLEGTPSYGHDYYNGASPHRVYDPPDLFPLEKYELEELQPLRDLDARLCEMGLPHFMEICDFDRRLALGLHLAEVHANDVRDLLLDDAGDRSSQRFKAIALSIESLQSGLENALGEKGFKLGPALDGVIEVLNVIAGFTPGTGPKANANANA